MILDANILERMHDIVTAKYMEKAIGIAKTPYLTPLSMGIGSDGDTLKLR